MEKHAKKVVVLLSFLLCLAACSSGHGIRGVAPYMFTDTGQMIEVVGSWARCDNKPYKLIDTTKIKCIENTGYCIEATSFQVENNLYVEPHGWKVKRWGSDVVLAESVENKECLFVDRKNRQVVQFITDSLGACRVDGSAEKIPLLDWYKDRR